MLSLDIDANELSWAIVLSRTPSLSVFALGMSSWTVRSGMLALVVDSTTFPSDAT